MTLFLICALEGNYFARLLGQGQPSLGLLFLNPPLEVGLRRISIAKSKSSLSHNETTMNINLCEGVYAMCMCALLTLQHNSHTFCLFMPSISRVRSVALRSLSCFRARSSFLSYAAQICQPCYLSVPHDAPEDLCAPSDTLPSPGISVPKGTSRPPFLRAASPTHASRHRRALVCDPKGTAGLRLWNEYKI